MLTSVFVIACVTLTQNVVHSKTINWKLNESVEVTITTETVTVTSTASNNYVDFLFDEPEPPTVSAVISPVTFGTSPHWFNETQTLYYVSVLGKTLMRYADGSHFKAKLDGMPTFIIPIEGKENHFVVGLHQKVVEIQWDGGVDRAVVLRTIAEVHMEHPEDRFSHGKADPKGRLFAGSMSHNHDPARTNKASGALYRFAEDGTPQKVLDNIDVSNGLCWDLAHKAFYFIDNFNYSIRRYDYDVVTGDISNPRIVFKMQDQEYIVANPNSYSQDITPDDLLSDSLELDQPGDHPIGRQGNDGNPQSLKIQRGLVGLLDRDDYYGGSNSDGSDDATDGSDEEASDGSTVAAPGPDYLEDGPQIRRQGDLQNYASFLGFTQSGPQGVFQSYAPSGPQDYDQSGPESNGQGALENDDTGGPQGISHDGPQGAFQSYAPSGPQDHGQSVLESNVQVGPEGDAAAVPEADATSRNDDVAPDGLKGDTSGGPQGYVETGPQIRHQNVSHGYTLGGLQGHTPGSPQDSPRAPGGTLGGPQADAPRGHAPVGPGILRTATVPDYYSLDLAQDIPHNIPETNNTGNFVDYMRDGPQNFAGNDLQDQDQGGPKDYASNGPQDFAGNGPKDYASNGPQDFAGNGPKDYASNGPQDFAGNGPQDYARNGPQDQAPGGPKVYGPADSLLFAPAEREKDTILKKKLSGTLDGMTIDTEGNLWVANYNGSQVLKIDPKTGKLLFVIPIETLLVTSVTFGGPNLDVLYVTSAATDSIDKKEKRSPAGATFTIINTGAKGHPNNNVRFTQSITRSNETKVDKNIDLT